jgi:amidase
MLHKFEPSTFHYTFGPGEPALIVNSGDCIVSRTLDAGGFDERMQPIDELQKPHGDAVLFEANPLVGPIYIKQALPGDMLAVNIQRIRLNRSSARSRHIPYLGCLTGETPGKNLLLNLPVPEQTFEWCLDLDRNLGTLELKESKLNKIEIPLHPFLGSIGVAPRFGRVEMSIANGEFGGNMDCIETRELTTLYLPVWLPGAYLSFGDVHAAQGDGEICGVALETTAEVTLQLDVIKGTRIDWPRMRDETHIMTVGNGRPLLDAVRLAQVEMVKWLIDDYGFEKWEAFQIISQVGTMRIGNIVNPGYTVVARFPVKYLPDIAS